MVHDTVATINVLNSILYANLEGPSVPAGTVLGSTCNLSQPPVSGGQSLGPFANPQFTFTSRGNFRLAFSSPAKDTGCNAPPTDLDGFLRPGGNVHFDKGAFEHDGVVATVPTAVGISGIGVRYSVSGAGWFLAVLVGVTGVVLFRSKHATSAQAVQQ